MTMTPVLVESEEWREESGAWRAECGEGRVEREMSCKYFL
jgi:hypothetical protein